MPGTYWKSVTAAVSGGTRNVLANMQSRFLGVTSLRESKTMGGDHYAAIRCVENVNAGDSVGMVITTPNTTTWAHMRVLAVSQYAALAYLYKAPTIASSTPYTPINSNQNSANSSSVVVGVAPDVTDAGTLISQIPLTSGSSSMLSTDWVLEKNQTYLVRVYSMTDNNVCTIKAEWYEHEDLS